MEDPSQSLVFNGLNGATGDYLLPPLTTAQVARFARGERLDVQHRKDLQARHFVQTQPSYHMVAGRDPTDLAQTGWGVIFARDADPAIREALAPLLDHRRLGAAATDERRYREYVGEDGCHPGESAYDFLGRFGVGPGPANPDKVPYYLLIVGDPETIPFHFQYQLDVVRAVGRVHFDTIEEYARYADSVVTTESSVSRPRRAVFFGVCNDGDPATALSATQLVAPLAVFLKSDQPEWSVETIVGPGQATKERLGQVLGGDQTPAFLFTASHGIGFPVDDPRLLPQQGALVCQDWPGPENHKGALSEDFYLGADDIGDGARLQGVIGFHFACYGAGTPRLDDFAHHAFEEAAPLAPHAFVAALPKRLLGHPKGGALAIVGHVERAWGCSFDWQGAGPQREVFESTF
ncbi:MAG: hypothetical protein H0U31_01885, partial [Chloroflexia bacterium]|nr:hypothetical protein [Chloroflexia bacterium]